MGLESQHFDNYDHLEPVPHRYGVAILSSAFVFFCFVNWLTKSRLHPTNVDPKDEWKWRNLFVSWIHAMIVGTWDVLCFWWYPEMRTDLVAYHNFSIYCMVAFSTGYFLYDFVDIVISGRSRSSWEVLLHHVAVSTTFGHNLVTSRCLAYTVVALMAEINSFFLHSRKLMQMLKFGFDAPLYRCNVYVNLGTFVLGRFFALVWIVYGMVVQYQRVGIVYMYLLSVAIFIMWVINIILFQRLIYSDIVRPMTAGAGKLRNGHVGNGIDHHSANNNGPVATKLRSNHVKYDELGHVSNNHKLHNGFKTS